MRKEVTVLEKKEGKIYVGCDRNACEGCKGNFFCRSKETLIEIRSDASVEVGDKVELSVPSGKAVFTVFMSLGLPLLMFPLFYAIASRFTEKEVYLFLISIAGVGIGFLISALFFRITKGVYEPELIEKT